MGKEEMIRVQFPISLELPFWINLRTGPYTFKHYNYFKQELDPEKVKILGGIPDVVDYTIILDNFMWKIGFDHINDKLNEMYNPLVITENLDENYIIQESTLKEHFGEKYNQIFHQKLKTVLISRQYNIKMIYDSEKKKKIKYLIRPFVEPIQKDFLRAINEFIQFYLGYFSTKNYCNEPYLISDPSFSHDKANVRIIINGEDKTREVGFPQLIYSPPYYPAMFPSTINETKFIEHLKGNKKPSFTRILIGHANHFFQHGDIRIAILNLDMALESCINDFIEAYNKENPDANLKISKNHTLGDFLKEDLPNLIKEITKQDMKESCEDVFKFHADERNLVIHFKKQKFNLSEIEKLRASVFKVIESIEDYLHLPKILSVDIEKSFIKNPIGVSLEEIEAGWWGKAKFFKSFTDMKSSLSKIKKNNK